MTRVKITIVSDNTDDVFDAAQAVREESGLRMGNLGYLRETKDGRSSGDIFGFWPEWKKGLDAVGPEYPNVVFLTETKGG